MHERKSDWGWGLAAGVILLLAGVGFVWQGRSGLLYHTAIYFKGPSWVGPWEAIIGGGLLTLLGLVFIIGALREKRR
jgi:putative Mn2+ efflux pump MntP